MEPELRPDTYTAAIASELTLTAAQVAATMSLLAEGGTVPFIARYRKERTDNLDEVAISAIRDRLAQLEELDSRRAAILKSLEEHGHLNEDLEKQVREAATLATLEDIYLPYRPKRRTRATIAREKGLEPLADLLFAQGGADPVEEAAAFVDAEKGVESVDDALAGARDIIAERVNEDSEIRAAVRKLFELEGVIRSKALANRMEDGAKFRDYFEWEEPLKSAPSHRVLAMRRGEKEGVLVLHVAPPVDSALGIITSRVVTGAGADADQVRLAAEDGYKRLLATSMETEMRLLSKKRAEEEAIRVFSDNLRELLLGAPLGSRSVMAIDPGFRTGCKLVCLDAQGKLLHNDTVYPGQGDRRDAEAAEKLTACVKQFGVQAIAIGNGTGGRELEAFIRGLALEGAPDVVMVNESGASVYSASEAAREEFPDYDLTVRGAVSIGRRLMDPLAELVKIDPKSIGVGQYQHDVDQSALKNKLDDVVSSSVNAVGVEVNTASKQLLTYVAGLGPQLAQNIVEYRNTQGAFSTRKQLLDVPRMGPKAFEQCAGFLRVRGGENPLDASAVHPESYGVVEEMAKSVSAEVADLLRDDALRSRLDLKAFVNETVGLPTLTDIVAELAKPGRDPREAFEAFSFTEGVNAIEDLKTGMKLPGIVTNVTAFGAFIDVGVHQDGLVHVSQLADRFVKEPADVVKVQQKVSVTVMDVDLKRGRISLSMKKDPFAEKPTRTPDSPRSEPRADTKSGGHTRPKSRAGGKRADRGPRQAPAANRPADSAIADALRRAGLN